MFEIATRAGVITNKKTNITASEMSQAVRRRMLGQRFLSTKGSPKKSISVIPKTMGHKGLPVAAARRWQAAFMRVWRA
jgi:hypothetical protein